MPPIDFSPAHAQPFTLEQAMQLEVELLAKEVARLQNSITHLRQTQEELEKYLVEGGEDGDEDGELRKAVQENEQVIASQSERITLIKIALLNKVGEGGMRHYGYDNPPDPPKSKLTNTTATTTTLTEPRPTTSISQQRTQEDGGMYL